MESLTIEQMTPIAVGGLSEESLAAILARRAEVERFFDALEHRAIQELRDGKEVPGWKLVEKATKRRWALDEDATAAKLMERGVEPWARALRPFSDVEKELGKGKIDDLLEKPKGEPELAPVSDRRPPWVEG